MDTFTTTFFVTILACIVTTIGIYTINRFAEWGKKNVIYFVSFAAGVLISVSFMHIIPEAFGMNKNSAVFLLIGFMALYLFNRVLHGYTCNHKQLKNYTFGIAPVIGIGLHSFLDGVIFSVTFNVSVFTGVLAAVGMVLHEFPEGVVTYLLLAKSGLSKTKSFIWAFIAAAISTPFGMIVSWPFISNLTPSLLGITLALSGGALVYVSTSHLLPKVEEERGVYTLLAMIAGIATAVVIVIGH